MINAWSPAAKRPPGQTVARLLLCAAAIAFAAAAADVQAERHTHFDPRSHTGLDRVITLCATEPGSRRFDQAWLNWLADNPQADVYGAVETVLSRAGTIRSMAIPGMTPAPQGRQPDPDAIADRMLSLAGKPRAR
jgi:hypothetical protein